MNTLAFPHWFADVSCEIAAVPAMLEGAATHGALWQATSNQFLLDIPAVARYHVTGGRCIAIDPASGSTATEVERYLRMTPLAALLYQRGALVFHAAAVAQSGKAILLAGNSGIGKSELLACLIEQDWTMLADDLAVVDFDAAGNLCVWPTFPEMVLWRDPDLSQDADRAAQHRRRCIVSAHRFAPTPLPLHSIYWLTLHPQHRIEMSEIQGAERFRIASMLTYNSRIASALLDRSQHFRRAAALARATPVRRLQRPRGQWTVQDLAALIIDKEGL